MTAARLRQWLPGALYGGPLRWTTPALAGVSAHPHIALTLDDGPDPASTPRLLETLDEFDVRATFFLIGEHIGPNRGFVGQMQDAGHELAVHGWTHRCVLAVPPAVLSEELRRTAGLIAEVAGVRPQWYRPPFGVTTIAAKDAARAGGLTPVLWTAWGRDWSHFVTSDGIVRRVERTLRPGGTVLLHDTDRYASPGSWTRTNTALRVLLTTWREHAIPVGPLGEHWNAPGQSSGASPKLRREGDNDLRPHRRSPQADGPRPSLIRCRYRSPR